MMRSAQEEEKNMAGYLLDASTTNGRVNARW